MRKVATYFSLITAILLGGASALYYLVSVNSDTPTTAKSVQIYKWQDSEGIWHFSEEKPDNPHQQITVHEPTIIMMDKPKTETVSSVSTTNNDDSGQTEKPRKKGRVIEHHGGPFPTPVKSTETSDSEDDAEFSDLTDKEDLQKQIDQLKQVLTNMRDPQ